MSIIFRNPNRSIHVHSTESRGRWLDVGEGQTSGGQQRHGGSAFDGSGHAYEDADGARPLHHDHSAEMFYVLDGSVQVLSGTDIVKAERGDVIVVPPRLPHAFAARRRIC